jgi:hypothetical protein
MERRKGRTKEKEGGGTGWRRIKREEKRDGGREESGGKERKECAGDSM